MTSPMPMNISCCSPATTESVAIVRDKIADSRSDLLVGQGNILRSQGDYTSAILQDVGANGAATNGNIDRLGLATMSQIDRYGLSGLSATRDEGDKVASQIDRTTHGLSSQVGIKTDMLGNQANQLAWAQESNMGHRFGEIRGQTERINDAQSAYSDRAFKYGFSQNSDSFARLSVQTENGNYRLGTAVTNAEKQTLHSQMGLERSLNSGFTDVNAFMRDSAARSSEQHCDIKSAIAAAQLAAAESFCETKRDILLSAKELGIQAAQNFGAVQVEASKNTAAIQVQAAVNQKESLLEQSKWFAIAERTAMLNKCEMEAKLAACCCEIKEAVSSTASATQSLIQSTESARLRDALTNATTENAILKLRHGGHGDHHHGGR